MAYKTNTIESLNTMCEEISDQLEKVETLLIEIELDTNEIFTSSSATNALIVVQDLLYDLR